MGVLSPLQDLRTYDFCNKETIKEIIVRYFSTSLTIPLISQVTATTSQDVGEMRSWLVSNHSKLSCLHKALGLMFLEPRRYFTVKLNRVLPFCWLDIWLLTDMTYMNTDLCGISKAKNYWSALCLHFSKVILIANRLQFLRSLCLSAEQITGITFMIRVGML